MTRSHISWQAGDAVLLVLNQRRPVMTPDALAKGTPHTSPPAHCVTLGESLSLSVLGLLPRSTGEWHPWVCITYPGAALGPTLTPALSPCGSRSARRPGTASPFPLPPSTFSKRGPGTTLRVPPLPPGPAVKTWRNYSGLESLLRRWHCRRSSSAGFPAAAPRLQGARGI